MKINTQQGFKIIRILNKLNIKDYIADAITKIASIESRKDNIYLNLNTLAEKENKDYTNLEQEEKEKIINKILTENKDIAKELENITEQENKQTINLVMLIVENLENAETDIYKLLAELNNTTEKEIRKQDISTTIQQIKEIIKSESFVSFFNLATR